MRTNSRGIASTVLIAIIIVVIAVAGVGVYFAFSGGSSPSTTTTGAASSTHSTTSTTAATTPHTSTTAQSSTTHSTTSTSAASSTHSTSSTTSAATTLSTYSCASTYTTGASVDYTNQYIALIKQYSSVEFKVNSVTNGTMENDTISYMVTSSSGGIYNANITFIAGGTVESGLAVVDANNNTVLSVTVSVSGYSYTYTGSQAKNFFSTFMGLFGLEVSYSTQSGLFTDSAYFHNTGTSTKSFGTTSFQVTTWEANVLPFSLNDCGVTDTITAYTLQLGTPPGTSLTFITYLHVATTSPSNEDVTFELVSMTVA